MSKTVLHTAVLSTDSRPQAEKEIPTNIIQEETGRRNVETMKSNNSDFKKHIPKSVPNPSTYEREIINTREGKWETAI